MVMLSLGSFFLNTVLFRLKNLTNANKLGARARQASVERAWASISRFYENVKKGVKGRKVGLPKFQQECRSVEYKTNLGKLADDRKSITFTDKCGICRLKMKGTRDLGLYNLSSNQAGEMS
jgi:putative transposase